MILKVRNAHSSHKHQMKEFPRQRTSGNSFIRRLNVSVRVRWTAFKTKSILSATFTKCDSRQRFMRLTCEERSGLSLPKTQKSQNSLSSTTSRSLKMVPLAMANSPSYQSVTREALLVTLESHMKILFQLRRRQL